MSLDTDRDAIRDALNTAPGITGYTHRPPAPAVGDAWPRLARLDLDRGLVWRPTWNVLVAMPTDEHAQGMFIESTFLPLVAALRAGNGFPDAAEPVYIPTEMGDVLALEITLRSH